MFDVIAGLIIGALSGLGVGGAGLLVIYLTAFRDIPQKAAQGINLYFFIFASASAMIIHNMKRKIDKKNAVLSLLTGIPAAYLGCIASSAAQPELLRKVFGGMLIICGGLTLLKRK